MWYFVCVCVHFRQNANKQLTIVVVASVYRAEAPLQGTIWWCDAIFDDQWKLCLVANSVNVICVMVNGPNVFVLIHFICRFISRFICHFLSFHFVSSSVPFINCATLSKSNILPSEKWQHKTSTLQCNGALQLFARASSLSDGNRILMTFTAAKLILPTRCCSKRLFPWIALASTN